VRYQLRAQIERFTWSYANIFNQQVIDSLKSTGFLWYPFTNFAACVHKLVGSLGHTASSAFHHTHYFATFLLAFYSFFRIGELAAKSTNSGSAVVWYNQLRFLTQKGNIHMIKITITKFKHNTTNHPFDILIKREHFAPFRLCSIFAKTEATSLGHFFAILTWAQSQFVSSMQNYIAAWYFVV